MSVPDSTFYVTGGTLRHDAPSYVERQADKDLFDGLLRGEFCYVLTSRQMGKSSLMVRTASKLREQGVNVVILDLTALGQNLTPEQWYDGLVAGMGSQLKLEDELENFWMNHQRRGPCHRLFAAISDLILPRLKQRSEKMKERVGAVSAESDLQMAASRLVVFVDELDTVRGLPFSTDEFFAGIRECYNRRTQDPAFNRLTFCLLGVATPSDLIRDSRLTPFNIGQRIELNDFTAEEATPLEQGLNLERRRGQKLLRHVLHWTNGHPYLTQRFCRAIAEDQKITGARNVDRLCHELFLSSRARERDDNLLFVRERLVNSNASLAALLTLYLQILGQNQPVGESEKDPATNALRLSGVVRNAGGRLQIRNRIYKTVFDREWVLSNLPDQETRRQRLAFRRGSALALRASAGLVTAVLGIGLSFSPLGEWLTHWSYDLLFSSRRAAPPNDVVIVYLDERSGRELKQDVQSMLDRGLIARLLERLCADKPRAVVSDNLEIDDSQSAQPICANVPVLRGAAHARRESFPSNSGMDILSYYPLADAAAGVGAPLGADSDLVFPRLLSGDNKFPLLDWTAAEIIGAPVTLTRVSENRRFVARWLNYYGPPGTIPHVSFYKALEPDGVPTAFFRDKVVYIGARPLALHSGERKDEFRTPFTWLAKAFSSGVEIHATALLNLLHQDWLTRPTPTIELGILLLAGLMLGYGLPLFRPVPATLLALAAALVVVALSVLCFWQWRIWFPWLLIVAIEIPVAWLSLMMINLTKLYLEKGSGFAPV